MREHFTLRRGGKSETLHLAEVQTAGGQLKLSRRVTDGFLIGQGGDGNTKVNGVKISHDLVK